MKKSSLLRGVTYSAIAIIATSPFMASAADGLFGTYFERMTGLCSSGEILTGFSNTTGSFGTKGCISLRTLMGSLYSSLSAPTGQAMLGFDTSGNPVFGSVNWLRTGSNIGFAGGRVGIGTSTPTALLDIAGGDAVINNLTIGRGGGNVLSNVAMGQAALQNNSAGASSNVAVGALTLMSNSIGTQNTAIGTTALRSNTTGENNIGIGSNSLQANVTGGWNTVIGSAALYANTVGGWNTAIGSQALYNNTSGSFNIGIGTFAGGNITSGSNNLAIGYYSSVPNGAASNQIRMGNTNVTYAGIQVPWTITSDRNLKTGIHEIPLGLDFIRELRPVSYTRKNDANHSVEFGFIAQDIEALLEKDDIKNSGMVSTDTLGIKSVRYNDFFAPVVRSIQEVDMSIIVLTKTIEDQNREINLLKSRLEALEGKTIQ